MKWDRGASLRRRMRGSRRRRQQQCRRIAERVEEAQRGGLAPRVRRESEVAAVLGDIAPLVLRREIEQAQQMRRFLGAAKVGQAPHDARRTLELRDVARIRRVAGVRQVAPRHFVVVIRRIEHRIGHVAVRHHVRCAEDHQVLGIACLEDRVDGRLHLAHVPGIGDRLALVLLHCGRVVEIDQARLDAARGIRRDHRIDCGLDLGQARALVLGDECRAIGDDDLVVHGAPPLGCVTVISLHGPPCGAGCKPAYGGRPAAT